MKRTEIHYQNTMDGQIRITGFNNVASRGELSDKFGEEFERIYLNLTNKDGDNKYFYVRHTDRIIYLGNGKTLSVGEIYSKNEFNDVIKFMRKAGSRAKRIWEYIYNNEVKTVYI